MAFAILLYKGYISLKPESNTQENYRKKKTLYAKTLNTYEKQNSATH